MPEPETNYPSQSIKQYKSEKYGKQDKSYKKGRGKPQYTENKQEKYDNDSYKPKQNKPQKSNYYEEREEYKSSPPTKKIL